MPGLAGLVWGGGHVRPWVASWEYSFPIKALEIQAGELEHCLNFQGLQGVTRAAIPKQSKSRAGIVQAAVMPDSTRLLTAVVGVLAMASDRMVRPYPLHRIVRQ